MSLSKVKVTLEYLETGTKEVYYGVYFPCECEAVFPFYNRNDFERALKTIANNEKEAMEKIYVAEGLGIHLLKN